jgi:signal peptidase
MFFLGVFPIKSSAILTESMKPIINPGDMVIIEKCDINQIKENDIIQYKVKDYTVVHRVIKINFDKTEIITKGDNNNNIDKPVSKDQIIGKIRFKIPYIGYPTYIFRKLIGTKLGE